MADFYIELAGPNAEADAEALRHAVGGHGQSQATPQGAVPAWTRWSSSPSLQPFCSHRHPLSLLPGLAWPAGAPARLPSTDDHHPARRHTHRAGPGGRGDGQGAAGVTRKSRFWPSCRLTSVPCMWHNRGAGVDYHEAPCVKGKRKPQPYGKGTATDSCDRT